MILGTAGHVDHGKTALVKALTGVDTDRLAEEKRRGITIELGFAPLRIGELTIGVVDVPGHEAFVRTMLAGATGVDLALLVVAADEGVMPQTREHLQILSLLGTRGGVVALSKCDLVDADWRGLVADEVRAALAGSPLADASIVPVSALKGSGLDDLRAAIVAAAKRSEARDARDHFRLPVDRAFAVKGTGTVVTGTVWSGSLAADATVHVLPAGVNARVRGVETHGAQAPAALPGTRAAIALAGIELADVARGATLVSGDGWHASTVILAELSLSSAAPRALGPRTAVRFHLGTQEVGARIVRAGGALTPGATAQARVILDHPIVARGGDRFVLRGGPSVTTIGGGIVNDPSPAGGRRARPWTAAARTPGERFRVLLERSGARGIAERDLPVKLGAAPAECERILGGANAAIVRLNAVVYPARAARELADRMIALVRAHHAKHPLEPGAPLQSIREQLGAGGELTDAAMRLASTELAVSGPIVRLATWSPTLDASAERRRASILQAVTDAGREPPSAAELDAKLGKGSAAILRLLEREGLVVPVEHDRWYAREAVRELVTALRSHAKPEREYSPSELREVLGFSRKFLIPFLEFCDRQGITERRASGRRVRPEPSP